MSQLFILGETIVPRKNTGWSPKSLVTSSQATSGIGTPQLFHKWAMDSRLCAIHYTTVPLRMLLVTLYFLIGFRPSYQTFTSPLTCPLLDRSVPPHSLLLLLSSCHPLLILHSPFPLLLYPSWIGVYPLSPSSDHLATPSSSSIAPFPSNSPLFS